MNMARTTLKCYLGDTGLLIYIAFDENTIASEQLYKKLILGKLEVNIGMLMGNIVAQEKERERLCYKLRLLALHNCEHGKT